MKKDIFKYALINSLLTVFYIGLVASFLFYGPRYFVFAGKPDTVFAPIMMLMLFVFSAAITSALVLGRPVLWYMDGRKKEAVSLFFATLSIFFAVMIFIFLLII
jgi:hypothetical protein